MKAKQKEEVISELKKVLKGLSSGEIEFLGIIRDSKPKYNPKGVVLKARESLITTITFQYK